MPLGIRDALALLNPKYGARLDEMDRAFEARSPKHPKRICGEAAPTRTKLGIDRVSGLSGPRPCVRKRRSDHLAEHLRNFRRRREVAVPPERIARRVIVSVARFHIGLDRYRAFFLDSLP
jgi:hypothetical protein